MSIIGLMLSIFVVGSIGAINFNNYL